MHRAGTSFFFFLLFFFSLSHLLGLSRLVSRRSGHDDVKNGFPRSRSIVGSGQGCKRRASSREDVTCWVMK